MLCGGPPVPHLSDEALLAHLAKERAPAAAKLRHWVEREIVFPARRRRGAGASATASGSNRWTFVPAIEPARQRRIRATSELVE